MQNIRNERRDALRLAIVAIAIATLVILAQIFLIKPSCIGDIDQLRFDLSGLPPIATSAPWINDWFREQTVPYKYRILGKLFVRVVYSVASLVSGEADEQSFYYSYVVCFFVSLAVTLAAFGIFVRKVVLQIHKKENGQTAYWLAVAGMVVFALSPPILFLTKFPVHGSPNDLLGYFLMLVALIFIFEGKLVAFCLVSTAGVFCRETTLLVPFIFLFFRQYPLQKRFIVASTPVLVFAVYRTVWYGSYDVLFGSHANASIPIETFAFLLLIFGPVWILGVLGYLEIRSALHRSNPGPLQDLVRSFPAGLTLTSVIVLTFASIREMRIGFILFFYFIPFALIWVYSNRSAILEIVRNKYFALFAIAALVLIFRLWVWMTPGNSEQLVELNNLIRLVLAGPLGFSHAGGESMYGYLATSQDNWTKILAVHLFLFTICLPFLLIRKRQKI